jgi:probable rRNA maturation factor
MTINVYDLTSTARVHEKNIIDLLMYAAGHEKKHKAPVNVVIAGDHYVQDLNKRFLQRDKPTSVIAFPMGEVSEIYVSIDQCRSDSDLYYYVLHGFLHLVGHDHTCAEDERAMHVLCQKYLSAALPDHAI